MSNWMLAIIIKPFVLVCLFSFTWVISNFLIRVFPDGKIKRILFFRWKV